MTDPISSAFSKIWSRCLPFNLLAPASADKRGPKVPFPLVENAGIQPVIPKRVPAGALAGAGSYWKHCISCNNHDIYFWPIYFCQSLIYPWVSEDDDNCLIFRFGYSQTSKILVGNYSLKNFFIRDPSLTSHTLTAKSRSLLLTR